MELLPLLVGAQDHRPLLLDGAELQAGEGGCLGAGGARRVASASSITCRAFPRTSTTSGGTGTAASGA